MADYDDSQRKTADASIFLELLNKLLHILHVKNDKSNYISAKTDQITIYFNMRDKDPIYRQARRRVRKKKGFYAHFSVYIAVGLFFMAMNVITDPYEMWFFYPLMPWGVGLLIHYFGVFGLPGKNKVLSKSWEEKEVEKEVRRLRNEQWQETEDKEEDFLDLREFEKQKPKVEVRKDKRWDEGDLV